MSSDVESELSERTAQIQDAGSVSCSAFFFLSCASQIVALSHNDMTGQAVSDQTRQLNIFLRPLCKVCSAETQREPGQLAST